MHYSSKLKASYSANLWLPMRNSPPQSIHPQLRSTLKALWSTILPLLVDSTAHGVELGKRRTQLYAPAPAVSPR